MIINENTDIDISKILETRSKKNRIKHLKKSCRKAVISGAVFEFGVFEGKTINIISDIFKHDTVYGFDSFEGLPEDWNGPDKFYQKEDFSTKDITVSNNVVLVKGWFEQSLPEFLDKNKNIKNIKFLHIDCDLYSSTITVLKNLNHLIVPGTVIVFDEFYNWKSPSYIFDQGELQAFKEWVKEYNRELKFIDRSNSYQISFIVKL
jgi:hypothetical protein